MFAYKLDNINTLEGHLNLLSIKNVRTRIGHSISAALFVVAMLVAGTAPAYAGTGDNYPEPWRSAPQNAYIDDWGYLSRQCTSWVAWALHDRNDFEMPRAIGNGANWGIWAQSNGYEVNSTPAIGAVAWWAAGTYDQGFNVGSYGHVAWVKAVNGSSVTIEEYNYMSNGLYHTRVMDKSNAQYIHFKDIGAGGGSTTITKSHSRDFDGDNNDDILWYGPNSAADAIWHGSNRTTKFDKSSDVTVNGDYTPIKGNFDGDNFADILWYGPGSAHDAIWYGTATKGQFVVRSIDVNGTYTPVVGDFNGNDQDDILWYGSGSASDAIWYGSSSRDLQFNKVFDVTISGVYTPVSGDFNGDNFADILWYGPGSAGDSLWYGTDTKGQFSTADIIVNGTYTAPVAGDFNGNGKTDILWYGSGSASDAIWYGSGDTNVQFVKTYDIAVSGTYTPVVGNFDDDDYDDILWYGPGSAGDSLWYGTDTKGVFSTSTIEVNGTYTPV